MKIERFQHLVILLIPFLVVSCDTEESASDDIIIADEPVNYVVAQTVTFPESSIEREYEFVYNDARQLIEKRTEGAVRKYFYEGERLVRIELERTGLTEIAASDQFTYDLEGRIFEIRSYELETDITRFIKYFYDSQSRMIKLQRFTGLENYEADSFDTQYEFMYSDLTNNFSSYRLTEPVDEGFGVANYEVSYDLAHNLSFGLGVDNSISFIFQAHTRGLNYTDNLIKDRTIIPSDDTPPVVVLRYENIFDYNGVLIERNRYNRLSDEFEELVLKITFEYETE